LYKDGLLKKLKDNFGLDSWLIIYFDNRYTQISSYGYWHNVILKRTLNIDLSESKYEKIIAIDAQGSAAVELYPFSYVICPEWRRQSTIIDECLFRKDSYYKI
jgi:hypothetical protein